MTTQACCRKVAPVIILAGQSNAVGVGYTEYLPRHFSPEKVAEFAAGYPTQINYFSHDKTSGGFVPVGLGCTERHKNTLGPEVGMAEMLTRDCPGETYFLIKCAVGGTSMWRDWLSPSGGEAYDPEARAESPEAAVYAVDHGQPLPTGWLYNELVALAKSSLAELSERGYTPQIKGFCWMQGEADACDAALTEQYEARFTALLRDLAEALSPYMEDCVVVDAGISEVWPMYREMNRIKADMAAEGPRGVYLDTVGHGLTTAKEPEGAVDHYHYDSDSVIALGRLFARAVLDHGV